MSGRIAERFTQIVALETGKLGTLSRAVDEQLGAPALILQLADHAVRDPAALDALIADNRRLSGCAYALISYAWGESDGQTWIASEARDGVLVDELLKRRDKLEMPQLLRLARSLAEVTQAAAAAGVEHLDLGPHRLIAEGEGLQGAIRAFGFGWWRLLPAVGPTPGELFYGAPEYLAAEICKGHAGAAASDIYSAATTVWTLAAAKPPFQSSQPLMTLKRQAVEKPLRLDLVKPGLKGVKELQGLVVEALDKDPAKRPTAAAWLAAIDALAATWSPGLGACDMPAQRAAALAAPATPAAPAQTVSVASQPTRAPVPTAAPVAVAAPEPTLAPEPAPAPEPAAPEPAAAPEPTSAAEATPAAAPAPEALTAAEVSDEEDDEGEAEAAAGTVQAGRPGKKGKKGKKDKQMPAAAQTSKVEVRPAAAPAKIEIAKTEPAKVESAKVEPAKVEPAKVEPGKPDLAKTQAAKPEPARVEPPKSAPPQASAKVDTSKAASGGLREVKTTDRVRVEAMHESAFFEVDHEPPKDLHLQGPPVPPPTKVSKPLLALLGLFALAMVVTAGVMMMQEPPQEAVTAKVEEPAEPAAPVAEPAPPPPPAPVEPTPAAAAAPVAPPAPSEADASAEGAAVAAPDVAAAVAPPPAPVEDPAVKAKALVDEGEGLLRDKNAEAALAKAKDALAANPGFAPAAALQARAEGAVAEATKAAAARDEQAKAAQAKQAAADEAKRKDDEAAAQNAEAERRKTAEADAKKAAAQEAKQAKADAAAAKAAQAKAAAEEAAARKAAEAKKAAESKPAPAAKKDPPPVKKDPPVVAAKDPAPAKPAAAEPSDDQKEAARFAALGQKAPSPKLKVLYLRKATEKDPGNGKYKSMLKQAEDELAKQQP